MEGNCDLGANRGAREQALLQETAPFLGSRRSRHPDGRHRTDRLARGYAIPFKDLGAPSHPRFFGLAALLKQMHDGSPVVQLDHGQPKAAAGRRPPQVPIITAVDKVTIRNGKEVLAECQVVRFLVVRLLGGSDARRILVVEGLPVNPFPLRKGVPLGQDAIHPAKSICPAIPAQVFSRCHSYHGCHPDATDQAGDAQQISNHSQPGL